MASSIYRDEQEGLRLRAQDLSLQIGEREARLTDAFWDAIPRTLSERLRELHRDAAAPHEEPAAAVADLEAYLATLDDALAQVPGLEIAGRLLPATAPHMMFPFEHQVGFASATRDFDAAGVGFMAALADFPGASLDSDYLRGWHRARFEWKGAPFVAGLILGGDQRVGAAAPFGREVKVARRAPDTMLDMGPPILDRLQPPLLLIRRNQECAQSTAVATCAFERVGPGRVPWRLQR